MVDDGHGGLLAGQLFDQVIGRFATDIARPKFTRQRRLRQQRRQFRHQIPLEIIATELPQYLSRSDAVRLQYLGLGGLQLQPVVKRQRSRSGGITQQTGLAPAGPSARMILAASWS